MGALDEQVGGNHYKDFSIQPVEFIHKNDLGFIAGNIVKYICRYKEKGGIKDLQKVKHYVEILLEFELKKPMMTLDDLWDLTKSDCQNLTRCNDCGEFIQKGKNIFCGEKKYESI